jgi:hypothetical protein
MRLTLGQNLLAGHPGQREDGLLAAVGVLPVASTISAWVCGAFFSGLSVGRPGAVSIWRISSRMAIIAAMKRSSSAFGLRFGRLDHDRAGHREAHRRRVEAVVHQALGDVDLGDAGGGLDRADVEDALVRDAALLPV